MPMCMCVCVCVCVSMQVPVVLKNLGVLEYSDELDQQV